MWTGASRRGRWNWPTATFWAVEFLWAITIVFGSRWNLAYLLEQFGECFGLRVPVSWLQHTALRFLSSSVLFLIPFGCWLFCSGFAERRRVVKAQMALSHIGLRTATGLEPKVFKVVELENMQRRILIHATGIDIAAFRDKKGALEASFNAIVHDIQNTPNNRQMVEIVVSDRELPTLVSFDKYSTRLAKPFTFLVGETLEGFVVADLREIHHMLVAGATGGGKSVFFKQALVGLLKSSQHIQMYLLDLKRGVELKPFDALDNVQIAKDETAALATLQVVVAEMDRRFRYMEEKRLTEIQSERDKLDRIVVAVDEASVLFTVEKSSKENRQTALSARDLTDKLAKLGRAAGIHVILATQKVVKETIDTRVQTNINAKMCFRVNTVASSMTVLGNKKAADLPDIKGRAIWSVGSNDVVVQVPRLTDEQLTEEIGSLTLKFNGDASPLKGPMLQVSVPRAENKAGNGLIAEGPEQIGESTGVPT